MTYILNNSDIKGLIFNYLRKIPKKQCVSCKRVCVWDDERHPIKDFMHYGPFVLCTYCNNYLFSCYIH